MKYFIIFGGFVGFTVTLLSACLAGTEIAAALRDASIGCLIGGLLLRFFHRTMTQCFRTMMEERLRKARAEKLQQAQEASV